MIKDIFDGEKWGQEVVSRESFMEINDNEKLKKPNIISYREKNKELNLVENVDKQ